MTTSKSAPITTDVKCLPVYRANSTYAAEHGELELYRASYRANCDCARAIEQAITDSYSYERWSLDTQAALKLVLGTYSAERVEYVLANTCRHKRNDGRIEGANKRWADSIDVCALPDGFGGDNTCYFVVDKNNPGLVNLLVAAFRQ